MHRYWKYGLNRIMATKIVRDKSCYSPAPRETIHLLDKFVFLSMFSTLACLRVVALMQTISK